MHILLTILLIGQYTQVAHNWVLHHQEEIGFSFFGPEKMEEKTKSIPTLTGIVDYHTLYGLGEGADSSMIFSVSHYAQPTPKDALDDAMTEAVLASVESVRGVLDYEAPTTINDRVAKIWRLTFREGEMHIKSKIVYEEGEFIIIQVVYPTDKRNNSKIEAFLDSFRFKD